MISDNERREVARRLRDEAAHGEMHIRDFLGALCACIKTERNAYRALLLLADLIEPSCDRDALLALADECDSVHMHKVARCIREACGEAVL